MTVKEYNNAVVLPGCDSDIHWGGVVTDQGEFVIGSDWGDMRCPHQYAYPKQKIIL